jgi:hypothetical protein
MNYVVMYFSLDLVSFTTAQPTAGTCTDTFQVGGSTSTVPIICGDNSGQHSESRICYNKQNGKNYFKIIC